MILSVLLFITVLITTPFYFPRYINGLLIPEINVVRGKTYTFVIEGGLDPDSPAAYHPFYITDDPEGGYEFKTPQERKQV